MEAICFLLSAYQNRYNFLQEAEGRVQCRQGWISHHHYIRSGYIDPHIIWQPLKPTIHSSKLRRQKGAPPKGVHGAHICTATAGRHRRRFNVAPWKLYHYIKCNMLQLPQDSLYCFINVLRQVPLAHSPSKSFMVLRRSISNRTSRSTTIGFSWTPVLQTVS